MPSFYNSIATVITPARPTTTHPAVREMVLEASELIGSEVCTAGDVLAAVGIDTAVGSAAGGTSAVPEGAAGGGTPDATGAGAATDCPGVIFSVALAQFALNPATDFSAVGLMANVIPA
jgi:hypothetical protein